jgi:hypothetical protein
MLLQKHSDSIATNLGSTPTCCVSSGISLYLVLASSRDCRLYKHQSILRYAICWWLALLLCRMQISMIECAHSMHRRVAPVPNSLDPLYEPHASSKRHHVRVEL